MTSNKQEYKGKNIDEAISAACADFKASQDELDIEVVTVGSAGIFGICKKKRLGKKRPGPVSKFIDRQKAGLELSQAIRQKLPEPFLVLQRPKIGECFLIILV